MVAQMNDESMRQVVYGLGCKTQCRSRGIVSCRVQKTDRYDHKTSHKNGTAVAEKGAMEKTWDFVLVEDDLEEERRSRCG